MKKITSLLFAIAICIFTFNGNAQNYILAGQYTFTDVYYDYVPDSSINATANGSAATMDLDLNLDGTADFQLFANAGGNPFGGNNNIKIIPYNQNSVGYDFVDSCINGAGTLLYTRNMAKSFPQGYYIGIANHWMNDTVHLHYNTYTIPGTPCNNSVNIDYVGTKVISGLDTLYGWIKLTYTNFGNITVQEFACNASPLSKLSESNLNSWKIMPNPCHETFEIQFGEVQGLVKMHLLDMSGRVVLEKIKTNENSISTDVSKLSEGIHQLSLQFNNGLVSNKKLMIVHP
jgi:hypothetical protein